ncbi:MAG TPA: 6,7-dimethyl-8-ribityllumazine synthase [Vicinamibacterales bacterium]|nr:6,7-dimethyl-8-ribityllumazine synthase [Vicinamibacterales bacterium]
MPAFEGGRAAAGLRFAIVVARFNDFVTTRLLAGAREALAAAGVADDAIDVVWVPGAFEIAVAAQHVAGTREVGAVICLGCVIRGGTPHFDYICSAAAHGVTQAASHTGVPMAFGVLTTDSVEQAVERAAAGPANKGYEAAVAAIEMATVVRALGPRA